MATNALLEKKGARTVLVTTAGFRDVLELRRIRVPRLYEPLYQRPDPLVPRDLRFEVSERIAADGSVIVTLDPARGCSSPRLATAKPEAIAVCLINAHANPAHRGRRSGAALATAAATGLLIIVGGCSAGAPANTHAHEHHGRERHYVGAGGRGHSLLLSLGSKARGCWHRSY